MLPLRWTIRNRVVTNFPLIMNDSWSWGLHIIFSNSEHVWVCGLVNSVRTNAVNWQNIMSRDAHKPFLLNRTLHWAWNTASQFVFCLKRTGLLSFPSHVSQSFFEIIERRAETLENPIFKAALSPDIGQDKVQDLIVWKLMCIVEVLVANREFFFQIERWQDEKAEWFRGHNSADTH